MGDAAKLLVSACLLGEPVRYDGQSKALKSQLKQLMVIQDRIIAFCPEVSGGLPIPREPAEIQRGQASRVMTLSGQDVTKAFRHGANLALELCRQHAIRVAVMTELSPSCGSNEVYDGSFRRARIKGSGLTTALLRQHGIKVFNQNQIAKAIIALDRHN